MVNNPPRIYLDQNWYWTEKGTYTQASKKTLSESISLNTTQLRNEGGMVPDEWGFNVVCFTSDELINLSGSFIKTTGDTRLAFSGLRSDAHMVYFDSMGPVKALDRIQTMFRVAVKLSSSEVGG